MIDYLGQKKATEKGIYDLVEGRNTDDELSKMQKNIGDLRGRFLERSEGLISKTGMGGDGKAGIATGMTTLDDKTQALLAQKKLKLQRQKIESVYNNAYEMAMKYTGDEQQATEYARQITSQEQEQEYGASEAEKQRAFKRKLDALAEQYGIDVSQLEDRFSESTDILPAVLGTALGTGTNIYLNRYLNRQNASKSSYKGNTSSYNSPYDYGSSRSV